VDRVPLKLLVAFIAILGVMILAFLLFAASNGIR
jgi:hypothetical protein